MKIYIVFGTTGEFSDRIEWILKAFTDKTKARELVKAASAEARKIFIKHKDHIFNIPEGLNKHDPDMRMDYTGTSYYMGETELDSEKLK